jgi:hypothetical protein
VTTPWADRGTAGAGWDSDPLPWGQLALRFLVLVPAAQLLGVLLGGAVATAAGLGPAVLSFLIGISGGLVAGVAVGLLVRPLGTRLRPYLLLCAGFAAVTTVIFFVITAALLAQGTGQGPGFPQYLTGVLLTTVVQTLVAGAVWVGRSRR